MPIVQKVGLSYLALLFRAILRVMLHDAFGLYSGGFLFGTVAGYAIKKVMKMAAIVIGLFVVGLISIIQRVDRCKMDRNVAGRAVHAFNNTALQFATHSTAVKTVTALPLAAAFGVHARSTIGFQKGIITISEGSVG